MTAAPPPSTLEPVSRVSPRHWWLAAGALAVAYALAVNDHWAITPDGALYLSLGRSLAEGRGMEFQGTPGYGFPPVVPLLIAACRLLTGDHLWLVNLAMSVCGLGAAVLSAAAVRRVAGDDLALGVLLVVGASAYLFVTSTRVQTDVVFTLLVAVGLYGFTRASHGSAAWAALGAVGLYAAILTRLLGLIFLAGALAGLLLGYRRPGYRWRALAAVLTAAVGGIVFLVWASRVRMLADTSGADYIEVLRVRLATFLDATHREHILEGLWALPKAAFSVILGQQFTPWAMVWPTLVLVLGLGAMARRGQWVLVLPTVFYAGFLLTWGGSAVARRYLLPAMPMLVYAFLVGLGAVVGWLRRRAPAERAARAARLAVTLAVGVCLAISLPKDVREIYWMRRPDFYRAYDHGKWWGTIQESAYLRGHSPPTDEALLLGGGVVHYLTRLCVSTRPAYEELDPAHPALIAPEEFVAFVLRQGFAFVDVQASDSRWSRSTQRLLESTGAFEPPREFPGLVLYKRIPFPLGPDAG